MIYHKDHHDNGWQVAVKADKPTTESGRLGCSLVVMPACLPDQGLGLKVTSNGVKQSVDCN